MLRLLKATQFKEPEMEHSVISGSSGCGTSGRSWDCATLHPQLFFKNGENMSFHVTKKRSCVENHHFHDINENTPFCLFFSFLFSVRFPTFHRHFQNRFSTGIFRKNFKKTSVFQLIFVFDNFFTTFFRGTKSSFKFKILLFYSFTA